MGSIGKFIDNIHNKITPWNDKSEGVYGYAKLTPWNEKTEGVAGIGKLTPWKNDPSSFLAGAADTVTVAVAALLAKSALASAAAQGSSVGTTLTTTAGQSVVVPSAETTGLSALGATDAAYFGTGLAPAEAAAVGGAGASGAAASSTAGGGGLFGSVLGFAKEYPYLSGGIAAGGLSATGNILAAQEMAKAQRQAIQEQARQFDLTHNYGGSFGGNAPILKQPQGKIEQIKYDPQQAAEIAMQKMKYDPAYKRGFETMAAKLINPDEAMTILTAAQRYYR